MIASALLVTACANSDIPNVRVCKEIPFLDAPEGACVWSASHKQELVDSKTWAKERPYQIILGPDDWALIKTVWLANCRIAGPNCNVTVDSIDALVHKLDALAASLKGVIF